MTWSLAASHWSSTRRVALHLKLPRHKSASWFVSTWAYQRHGQWGKLSHLYLFVIRTDWAATTIRSITASLVIARHIFFSRQQRWPLYIADQRLTDTGCIKFRRLMSYVDAVHAVSPQETPRRPVSRSSIAPRCQTMRAMRPDKYSTAALKKF